MRAKLRAWIASATQALAESGIPSPRHDAEMLAAHAHGVERRDLWRVEELDESFWAYVERRRAREPLQHILGRTWFRYAELAVGPGVFVPRPETEVVAGAAVEEGRRVVAERGSAVVVDLCTGSGAIALAVATEVPGSRVHAVEREDAAHAWAARNLEGTGVDLRRGDMAEAFRDLDGTVDVVVSNPPYIPVGAIPRDPEVGHDPDAALWSGEDGLDAMRVLADVGTRLLRPGGLLVAEHADMQDESAPAVFRERPEWVEVCDAPDLGGRPRYVTARRAGPVRVTDDPPSPPGRMTP